MSFKVSFFTLNKRKNSTKQPDLANPAKLYDVRLKDSCGIVNPALELRLPMGDTPARLNYAYIPQFGDRFYFINEWTFVGGVWYAALNVDTLATYKQLIGNSTQYVLRSSAAADGNVTDNLYPGNGNIVKTISTADAAYWPYSNIANGCYVVGIINKATNTLGAVSYYAFTQEQFNSLCAYLMGDVDWLGNITDVSPELLKALFNPFQYIVSCIWFPYRMGGTAQTSIPFGWWDIPVQGTALNYLNSIPEVIRITVPKHPQAATRGNYLNLAPFASYTLDTRVWGILPIDTTALKNIETLALEVKSDFVTGMSELTVTSGDSDASGYVIARSTAMYGVPIQLAQIARDYMGAATKAVSGIASTISSALMGDVAGAITSAISGIGNTVNAVMPDFSTSGSNGSLLPFRTPPSLSAKFMYVVDADNADLGRPLCKPRQLSTIPGYIMVLHADVALPATVTENQTVKEYMESGFFYE